MALFKASDLLNDKETTHVITIEGFKNQETGEVLNTDIEVKTSTSLVEKVMAIVDESVTVDQYRITKGKRKGQVKISTEVNHDNFVKKTLDLVYVSSSGDVVDEHSKEVLLALVKKYPDFKTDLSNELLAYYQGQDVYKKKEEEEDSKN